MKSKIFLMGCLIFLISRCEQRKKVENTTGDNKVNAIDNFYTKVKKIYPALELQVDTSALYNEEYKKILQIDSVDCLSFSLNRNHLGNISNVLFEVESNNNKTYQCHIKSGNLKLWVCKLPIEIKVKDKILVNAFVYDNNGYEKLYGYPAILTNIKIK